MSVLNIMARNAESGLVALPAAPGFFKNSLHLQMSYFYDFHLLDCSQVLAFSDLKICLSICSQLYNGRLKFQLFPYCFWSDLLILLHASLNLHFCFLSFFSLFLFCLKFFCYFICFCYFYHLLYYTSLFSVSLMGFGININLNVNTRIYR